MSHLSRAGRAALSSLLLVTAACAKEAVLLERTVTPVGAGGGTARSADGQASLSFAAAALTSATDIVIETRREVSHSRLRSFVYDLGPEGLTFGGPVALTITAASADEELAIANFDGPTPVIVAGSTWDPATRQARAPLAHFSSYGAVVVYNPCAGLTCGDSCTICDPTVAGCVEPAPIPKSCNRSHLCVEAASVICIQPDAGPTLPDALPLDAQPLDGGDPGDGARPLDGGDPGDGAQPLDGGDAGDAPDALPLDSGVVTCIDTFQQHPQPIVDILLVVDNSASMAEEQTTLAADFALLLDTLTQNNADFHIGVTSTDVDALTPGSSGTLVANPTVLSSSTPNLASVFTNHVNLGTDGSAAEQGLEAMRLALSSTLSSGANTGFLRDDSGLVVIVLSDEDDQSPDSPANYAQFLWSLRDPEQVQLNAITGEAFGGCGGGAAPGLGYDDVMRLTNGAFSSICQAPWTQALTDLGPANFGFTTAFHLSQPAPGGIISVTLDGVPVPAMSANGTINWTYEPATATLRFAPTSTPEPGVEIVVTSGC